MLKKVHANCLQRNKVMVIKLKEGTQLLLCAIKGAEVMILS